MTSRLHIAHLVWDEWNRDHIAKQRVLPEEVEEVIAGELAVHGTYKQRLQLIGPTLSGRVLSIVIGFVPRQPDVYYVFCTRPASR